MVTNDLNLDETAYCMESAKQNGIHVGENDEERFGVQCGDAREFIMNLGICVSAAKSSVSSTSSMEGGEDDDNIVAAVPPINGNKLPDHMLLTFLLDLPKFLQLLVVWCKPM